MTVQDAAAGLARGDLERLEELYVAFFSRTPNAGRESRGSLVSTIPDSAHSFKGDATWGWVADLLEGLDLRARAPASIIPGCR